MKEMKAGRRVLKAVRWAAYQENSWGDTRLGTVRARYEQEALRQAKAKYRETTHVRQVK